MTDMQLGDDDDTDGKTISHTRQCWKMTLSKVHHILTGKSFQERKFFIQARNEVQNCPEKHQRLL